MTDSLNTEQRSALMAKVRGKNTKPELIVRKLLHALGYRFRLHRRDLPGCPDIVLPKHKTVIFVHGCFWHGHNKKGCRGARIPKSNVEFWTNKICGNAKRDQQVRRSLRADGWKVVTLWECELNNLDRTEQKMVKIFTDK